MLCQWLAVCAALAPAVLSTSDPGPVPPPPDGMLMPPALPDCACSNGTHAACLAGIDEWWGPPPAIWPPSPCAKQCTGEAGADGKTAMQLNEARDKCMADFSELVNQCALEQTKKGENGCVHADWAGMPAPIAGWLDMGHHHVDAALGRLYESIDYTGCMNACSLPETGGPPPAPADGEPYSMPFADECGCIAYFDYNKCERRVAGEKYAGAPPICACVAAAVPEAKLDCSAPPPTPAPPPPVCDCADATQAACVKEQALPDSGPPPAPPLPACHQRCAEETAGYEQIELLERASDKCYRRHNKAVNACLNRKIKEGTMGCADGGQPPPPAPDVLTGGDKVWDYRLDLESTTGLAQCLDKCYTVGQPPAPAEDAVHKRSVPLGAGLAPLYQPPFVEQCGCYAQVDHSACEAEQPAGSICRCVAEAVAGLDCKKPVPTSEPIFLQVKK